MQALSADGVVAAVFGSVSQVAEVLAKFAGGLDLTAINGPDETVISGRIESVAAACQRLESAGTRTQRLDVARAFHSRLTEPMLEQFAEFLKQHSLRVPSIPFVSNFRLRDRLQVSLERELPATLILHYPTITVFDAIRRNWSGDRYASSHNHFQEGCGPGLHKYFLRIRTKFVRV
jgi:malonyl CoA-acyl carrier protein transacylase